MCTQRTTLWNLGSLEKKRQATWKHSNNSSQSISQWRHDGPADRLKPVMHIPPPHKTGASHFCERSLHRWFPHSTVIRAPTRSNRATLPLPRTHPRWKTPFKLPHTSSANAARLWDQVPLVCLCYSFTPLTYVYVLREADHRKTPRKVSKDSRWYWWDIHSPNTPYSVVLRFPRKEK